MRAHLWTSGPFRGWPASRSEETEFINHARDDADEEAVLDTPVTRSDIVAVSVSLREGAEYGALREFLPGLTAEGLVSSYEYLEAGRVRSLEAWNYIEKLHSFTATILNAARAAEVVPAAVGRLLREMQQGKNELHFVRCVQSFEERIREETRTALRLEKELHNPRYSPKTKLRIGEELFHPARECAWMSPYYLPSRVTDLSPERINSIMGESLRTGSKDV